MRRAVGRLQADEAGVSGAGMRIRPPPSLPWD